MASVRPFHRFRGESSFTLSQFIAILRELLPQVVPAQSKYRVTDVPSERTIRFYTANKLVDKPIAPTGTQARYGYRHLLQVIAIKYLQSQYLPLVKIRSLVENISNRDLEHLIPERSSTAAANRVLGRADQPAVENQFIPQAIPFKSGKLNDQPPAVENDAADALINNTWRRVEIGPGIELHVHTAVLPEKAIEQLRGTLLRELGVLRGWFGEG